MVALLLGLSIQMGGCGSSGGAGASAGSTETNSAPIASTSPERAEAGDWGQLKKFASGLANRLLIPKGTAPGKVVIRDLKLGEGRVIAPNDRFSTNYVSFGYTNGIVFEDRWHKQPGFRFWNIEGVVDGWVPGLKGMRVGGIRELIVPAELAYGNGALVYLVKLQQVEPR
ncbi:MAG: FKBP-type peptidyl-prolyl cis-trans isomerase [Solirubrobacterales bacterium]